MSWILSSRDIWVDGEYDKLIIIQHHQYVRKVAKRDIFQPQIYLQST